MDNGLTPTQDAWLRSQAHREAFEDLSAEDINRMDMATFARVTGRATPTQAALQALDKQEPPQAPQQAPGAPQDPEYLSQGVDLSNLSMADYETLRGQLIGRPQQEGRGIFDSVGSRSEEYRSAARAQAGRTGWSTSNVVEPPRLEGRYVRQGDRLDHRSAAERLSNAANLWQGR